MKELKMFYLRQQFELTPDLEKVLHRQSIEAHSPGTILPDFQQLLDFVGEGGIPVTGTYLLPLKFLKPLNERLNQPIQLGLKRPQQKSYPHLNGLYLLLRTTGLSQIDTKPKKPQLVIDRDVLQSWAGLNPAEQYLTLLETWTMRGRGEVIGEGRAYFWSDAPLVSWAYFFEKIPTKGLPIAGNSDMENTIIYWPKLHNLALLELFGLLGVQHGPVIEGEGWQIERVWRTPLGDALLAVLVNFIQENYMEILEYEDPSEIPFGVLQPVLQPYFPQWQNNLTFPAVEFQEGVFILKVSLWGGEIWRRIAIPATMTLDDLATMIINAYEFDFDHLYKFTYANRFGAAKQVTHPYMEEYPATPEVQIGELPLQPGALMEFVYDFGDWWEFDVILEKVDPPDARMTKPAILESHGESPQQYPIWDEDEWE
jgi:hypothetical protein